MTRLRRGSRWRTAPRAEELARLAREQPMLRSYCLVALASLDESACHIRLAGLMDDKEPEVRYGAFRAGAWTNDAQRSPVSS